MNPQISIIIPLYNSENWMSRAIDSVLNQTLKNLELILVDDGSSDKSLAIAHDYSEKDDRVIVIHQKNEGPGAARNCGIVAARGSFIGFVDSDDYVEPQMYEDLINLANRFSLNVVACPYLVEQDGVTRVVCSNFIPNEIVPRKKIETDILSDLIGNCHYGFASLWNKIYRKKFLDSLNISLDKRRRHGEDWWFNIQVFDNLDAFAYSANPCYHYVQQNNNSLMKSIDEKRFSTYLKGYKQCCWVGEKYGLPLEETKRNFILQSYSYTRICCTLRCVTNVLDCQELKKCVESYKYKMLSAFVLKLGFVFGETFYLKLVKLIGFIKK